MSRSVWSALLAGAFLVGCVEQVPVGQVPPGMEDTLRPQSSPPATQPAADTNSAPTLEERIETTVAKYEAAMAEVLDSGSRLAEDMDDIRDALTDRSSQSLEERIEILEAFNDAYVASMRSYIRTQTPFRNWLAQIHRAFDENVGPVIPIDGTLSKMEAVLNLENGAGRTQIDRLAAIDTALMKRYQNTVAKKRAEASLLERAELCVVRTRLPSGAFIRYESLIGMTIQRKYSATGERQESLGMIRTLFERKLGGSILFSTEVQDALDRVGYQGEMRALIGEEFPIDPEDDTLYIKNKWEHAYVYLLTSKSKNEGILSIRLEDAKVQVQQADRVEVEAPVTTQDEEQIATATLEIRLKQDDFQIENITFESLTEEGVALDAEGGLKIAD